MGMLTRTREVWAALTAPVASGNQIARIVQTWQSARPLQPTADLRLLTDWGYRKQSLIYACIVEIATSAAEPELKVGRRQSDGSIKDVEDGHPLAVLLRNPNPDQSQFDLVEQMLTHLNVAGNIYLHKARSVRGNTVQLWTLRPDRTKIKVDRFGQVEFYEYSLDGINKQFPPAADVIHTKLPDPLDDFYGMSPLVALQRAGQLDVDAIDFMRAFFTNAGSPSGILKFKQKMIKEERERVQELWRDQHTGRDSWHNVSVLDSDVDYTSLGGSPERLRINFIFDATETRICMAFGVPPIVVGAAIGLNRATFANYREARRSLWNETLSPTYRRIAEAMTRGFRAEFGEDIVVYFSMEKVGALQEDQDARRTYGLEAWTAGLCTKDEGREMAGLDPVTDGTGEEYRTDSAGMPSLTDPLGRLLNPGVNGTQLARTPDTEIAAAVNQLEAAVTKALGESESGA